MIKRSTKYRVAMLAALMALPGMGCAQTTRTMDKKPMKNIVEVAVENGSFTTLVAAVKAAGLVDVLTGPGPFTVFAPTDAAFAKLPAGTVEALLANKEQLAAVLTYHVVPGKVTASDVLAMKTGKPTTVEGQTVNIVVRDGKVYVNDALVVMADVQASNGVIHVIDAVLIPSAKAVPAGR